MEQKNTYPLIYLEWCDAMNNQNTWLSCDDAIRWAEANNWIISEVGFLLKETDEYILIASKKNLYDNDAPEVGGIVKIPSTWIKKRIDLTEYVS